MGNRRDGFVNVVEDDHAIIEGEAQVGQLAVVHGRVGQAFHVAHGVVGGISDGPAGGKPRQAGQVRGAVVGHLLFKQPQRVGMLDLDGRAAGGLEDDAVAEGLEAQERAGAEEAITSDALASDDTLEKKRPVAVLDFAERADGGERVAKELAGTAPALRLA